MAATPARASEPCERTLAVALDGIAIRDREIEELQALRAKDRELVAQLQGQLGEAWAAAAEKPEPWLSDEMKFALGIVAGFGLTWAIARAVR